MPHPKLNVFQGGKMTDPEIIEKNEFVWIVKIRRRGRDR
jgi:hypothetical protein